MPFNISIVSCPASPYSPGTCEYGQLPGGKCWFFCRFAGEPYFHCIFSCITSNPNPTNHVYVLCPPVQNKSTQLILTLIPTLASLIDTTFSPQWVFQCRFILKAGRHAIHQQMTPCLMPADELRGFYFFLWWVKQMSSRFRHHQQSKTHPCQQRKGARKLWARCNCFVPLSPFKTKQTHRSNNIWALMIQKWTELLLRWLLPQVTGAILWQTH